MYSECVEMVDWFDYLGESSPKIQVENEERVKLRIVNYSEFCQNRKNNIGDYAGSDAARLARARRTGIRSAQKLKYALQNSISPIAGTNVNRSVYVPGSKLLVKPKVVKAKKKVVKQPGIKS